MNPCLTPRHCRDETLKLLTDMVTTNEWKPGIRHSQALGRGFITPDIDNKPCNLAYVLTWGRTPGPQPQGTNPAMRQPVSWPKCLDRDFPNASPHTPPPMPSSNSESDFSGPSFIRAHNWTRAQL